jgi:hypothetical protein
MGVRVRVRVRMEKERVDVLGDAFLKFKLSTSCECIDFSLSCRTFLIVLSCTVFSLTFTFFDFSFIGCPTSIPLTFHFVELLLTCTQFLFALFEEF